MSDTFIPELIEETTTGIFARHPQRFELPVLVAPTTDDRAAASNRVRPSLVTVACANLKDFAFAFDSSFLAPASADGFDESGQAAGAVPRLAPSRSSGTPIRSEVRCTTSSSASAARGRCSVCCSGGPRSGSISSRARIRRPETCGASGRFRR